MTDRCEKGSPCVYQTKFKLSYSKGVINTCGQHLNFFLDEIYSNFPTEVVEVRRI